MIILKRVDCYFITIADELETHMSKIEGHIEGILFVVTAILLCLGFLIHNENIFITSVVCGSIFVICMSCYPNVNSYVIQIDGTRHTRYIEYTGDTAKDKSEIRNAVCELETIANGMVAMDKKNRDEAQRMKDAVLNVTTDYNKNEITKEHE